MEAGDQEWQTSQEQHQMCIRDRLNGGCFSEFPCRCYAQRKAGWLSCYVWGSESLIGRIAKWACELGSHDIEFRPRTAIKTQALVDFVSEWTEQQVPDNPETTEVWCWGRASVRRRSYTKKQLRLNSPPGDGRRSLFHGASALQTDIEIKWPFYAYRSESML